MADIKKWLDENGLLYFWSKVNSLFVRKEAGKGLSTNDYTASEKEKLSGIEAGANKYTLPTATTGTLGGIKIGAGLEVKEDGTVNSTYGGTADAVDWSGVQNKPTTIEGYGITDVESGAEANVQADWSETSAASDAFIKNKPSIPTKTSDLTNDSNFPVDANYVHTDSNFTTSEKEKLAGVATGADVSPIASVKKNGTVVAVDADKSVNIVVPTKTSDITNDSGYLTTHQDISGKADKADTYTKDEVDGKLSSVYKPQGNSTFAALPVPAAANLGYVYNVTDSFTSTTSFVEGAGKEYPAGTNVVVVQNGASYLFDVQGGFYDMSPYAKTADFTAITNAEIDTIVAS